MQHGRQKQFGYSSFPGVNSGSLFWPVVTPELLKYPCFRWSSPICPKTMHRPGAIFAFYFRTEVFLVETMKLCILLDYIGFWDWFLDCGKRETLLTTGNTHSSVQIFISLIMFLINLYCCHFGYKDHMYVHVIFILRDSTVEPRRVVHFVCHGPELIWR